MKEQQKIGFAWKAGAKKVHGEKIRLSIIKKAKQPVKNLNKNVQKIMDMGFSEEEAMGALIKNANNCDEAIDYLYKNSGKKNRSP
jgi:hypothetical protein